MRPLSLREIAGDAEPPIADQFVSPNALRQRRFRERRALRDDVTRALQDPRVTPDDEADSDTSKKRRAPPAAGARRPSFCGERRQHVNTRTRRLRPPTATMRSTASLEPRRRAAATGL